MWKLGKSLMAAVAAGGWLGGYLLKLDTRQRYAEATSKPRIVPSLTHLHILLWIIYCKHNNKLPVN